MHITNFSAIKELTPFVISLVLLLGVIAALFHLVIPYDIRLWNQWSELPKKELDNEFLQTKEQYLSKLSQTELVSFINTLERILPSQKDVFAVINGVEGLAAKTGSKIGNFSFTPGLISTASSIKSGDNTMGGLAKNSFTLSLLAPKSAIHMILKELYEMTPFFSVPSIKMLFHASGQVDLEIDLETYTQPSLSLFGDVTTKVPELGPADKTLLGDLGKWQTFSGISPDAFVATTSGRRTNLFSF